MLHAAVCLSDSVVCSLTVQPTVSPAALMVDVEEGGEMTVRVKSNKGDITVRENATKLAAGPGQRAAGCAQLRGGLTRLSVCPHAFFVCLLFSHHAVRLVLCAR